jgi:hypothetical protein
LPRLDLEVVIRDDLLPLTTVLEGPSQESGRDRALALVSFYRRALTFSVLYDPL